MVNDIFTLNLTNPLFRVYRVRLGGVVIEVTALAAPLPIVVYCVYRFPMAGVNQHSVRSLLNESTPSPPIQDMDEDAVAAGTGVQTPLSNTDTAAVPSMTVLTVHTSLAPSQGRYAILLGVYSTPLTDVQIYTL